MTGSRTLTLLCGAALLLAGTHAVAQEPPVRQAPALVGLWEGFDSTGALLDADFSLVSREGVDQILFRARARSAANVSDRDAVYAFRAGDDATSYLVGGAGEPVVVTWYSDFGVRLSWPDGRQAVLTQLSAGGPSLSGSSVMTAAFSDAVQAGLLSLEGSWRALVPGDAGEEAAVEIRALDPATGRLEWRGTLDPLGAPLDAAGELVLLRANDPTWRFRFDDHELLFTWAEGQVLVQAPDETPGVTLRRP